MKPDTREKAVLSGSPENKQERRGGGEPTGTVCDLEEEIRARKNPPPGRSTEKPEDGGDDPDNDGVVHEMELEMRAAALDKKGEEEEVPPPGFRGTVHVMEMQMKGEAIKDELAPGPDEPVIDNTLPPEGGEGLEKPPPGTEPPLGGSRNLGGEALVAPSSPRPGRPRK